MSRYRVVTVCTANICRSPLAELLLRDALDPELFEVASAGVRGWEAAPMDPDAAAQAVRLGVDPSAFRSRPLTETIAAEADLILTATRDHRAAVLQLSPRSLKRTFTLLELAELTGLLDDLPLEHRAASAARHRSRIKVASALDVDDPYRASAGVHTRVADQIHAAVTTVAAALSR